MMSDPTDKQAIYWLAVTAQEAIAMAEFFARQCASLKSKNEELQKPFLERIKANILAANTNPEEAK